MFSVEELLQPIETNSPSGRDLRYDAVIDAIQEARSEEDDSLPMGDWARQAKRADYPQAASLTRNALLKSSKDLWLAVWLGEATIKTDEYAALKPVLTFLLELQKQFWPSLFPEMEDGDRSLRAAPLHWGLARYSKLLHEFPVTNDGISYEEHKAIRAGNLPAVQDENSLTAEKLDAAIAGTPKAFYADSNTALGEARASLDELYLFCEENYGEDGPSFVSFRTALEELQNLISQLLRMKQAQEPDPVPMEPPPAIPEQAQALDIYTPVEKKAPFEQTGAISPVQAAPHVMRQQESTLSSWDDAVRQLSRCADYLIEQHANHSSTYLLALALQESGDSFEESAPSSETRLTLKKASDSGDWDTLLRESLTVLRRDTGRRWLDLYRYLWQASQAFGNTVLQEFVLVQTRVLLERDASRSQGFFADDTPVANVETQRWLTNNVLPPEVPQPTVENYPVLPPLQETHTENSPYDEARELASRGELTTAVRFLLTQNNEKKSARQDFLRRTQVCRLLMESGRNEAAVPLLRQLVEEIEHKHLQEWEEPSVLSEVFSLLLQALPLGENSQERETIYAQLCRLDPATALALQPVA